LVYFFNTVLSATPGGTRYNDDCLNSQDFPDGYRVSSSVPWNLTPSCSSVITVGSGGLTLYMSNTHVSFSGTVQYSGGQRLYAIRIA
jgi:hypothetical protein